MITGGNATVYVSNMDKAVSFYTETLGLKLVARYNDHWATVQAGGTTIGLHPATQGYPGPGTKGAVMVGLETRTPLDAEIESLTARGVKFTGAVVRSPSGNFVDLEDPDGNPMYLWEVPAGMGS